MASALRDGICSEAVRDDTHLLSDDATHAEKNTMYLAVVAPKK